MRTVPVHIAFLRVNLWRPVPLHMHIAARNAVVQFLHHAGTHQISASNSEVQLCTVPVHTQFALATPRYKFVPCRHKPFFPQMNRRYKICTVLAKPYIAGRKAEVKYRYRSGLLLENQRYNSVLCWCKPDSCLELRGTTVHRAGTFLHRFLLNQEYK